MSVTATIVGAGEGLCETITRAVYLAGPTAGDGRNPSWRSAAVDLLDGRGFDGEIFIPERRGGSADDSEDRIAWEADAQEMADVILFWLPRDTDTMTGVAATDLTLGAWAASGKVVLGTADGGSGNRRLAAAAAGHGIALHTTLDATVAAALAALGAPAARAGADRFVPLRLWRSASFQAWRSDLLSAGHTVEGNRVLWSFPATAGAEPFAWVCHPHIAVAGESRTKGNEVVVARPGISSVCAWGRGPSGELEVVLVREFRSTSGHLFELPGGSSDVIDDPLEVAVAELAEEAGLRLDRSRFVAHGARRCAGTFSAHAAYLFSVELSADELDGLRADTTVHGAGDHERTTVEVLAVDGLADARGVDWTTIGMVRHVLATSTGGPQR